jgi:hypothetical protein
MYTGSLSPSWAEVDHKMNYDDYGDPDEFERKAEWQRLEDSLLAQRLPEVIRLISEYRSDTGWTTNIEHNHLDDLIDAANNWLKLRGEA